MPTTRIAFSGPFDLDVSASFLCGFAPGAGTSSADEGSLALGFLRDGTYAPTVVRVRQDGRGVEVEHEAEDDGAIAAQVARILSLDHDGRAMAEIARRDPVVRAELSRRPGFRPVAFPSPYEAAVWGVLAQRTTMTQASALKRRLSIATRSVATGLGAMFFPAPTPEAVLCLDRFAGLAEEKLARLHAVARAALAGELDAATLRAMPEDEALARLQTIRGVGAWTSQHVLYRGAGVADAFPDAEPRVLRAIGEAYGLGRTATADEALEKMEGWRPLRMWISVLLVSALARTPRWHGSEPRGAALTARARQARERQARPRQLPLAPAA